VDGDLAPPTSSAPPGRAGRRPGGRPATRGARRAPKARWACD
jgi:hypothetical protein